MSIFDDVTREQDMTALTQAERPRARERQGARADRLGHFQLLEEIRDGTYSAYDLRRDRKVVIKLLDNDAGSPEHRMQRDQRLLRNAGAMAKLKHENVVSIYEVGVDNDRLFIAMEHVAGDTLATWLKNGARTWRDIVGVFAQAGRGLAAAHEAGIVHGDVKPASVLVDGKRRVRITDLGTAAVDAPNVDARADQLAFCASLFEALFGKRPDDTPDPKSKVPSRITAAVRRGLAVDPGARFPSMTALVDALDHDPSRRRKRIAIGVLAAGAIAGAAVVGWQVRGSPAEECTVAGAPFAGVWDDTVRGAIARSFAETGVAYADSTAKSVAAFLDRYRDGWIAMRTDACRAHGDQHLLDLRIACLDRRREEVRALTTLLAGPSDARTVELSPDAASGLISLARCADTVALLQSGAERSERTADLEARLAKLATLFRLGRAKDGLDPARGVVDDARRLGDSRLLAEALGVQGVLEATAGDLTSAETAHGEALRHARDTGDLGVLATATVRLGESLATGGASTGSEALGVIRVARALVDSSRDPVLPIRLQLAEVRVDYALGHRELALPLLQQAAEQSRKTLPDDQILQLHIQSQLAAVLSSEHLNAEALAQYDALVAGTTRMLGPLHPMTTAARLDMCAAASKAERAVACYEATLADGDRILGPTTRGMLLARAYYARALVDTGKPDRAAKVYSEALAHVPADAWIEHWSAGADLARGLGMLELEQGKYKAALDHCSIALDNTEKPRRGLTDQTCIGEAQLGLGKAAAALATLEPLEGEAGTYPTPNRVGEWRFAYARAVWAARHDARAAREIANRAREDLRDKSKLEAWLAKLPRH